MALLFPFCGSTEIGGWLSLNRSCGSVGPLDSQARLSLLFEVTNCDLIRFSFLELAGISMDIQLRSSTNRLKPPRNFTKSGISSKNHPKRRFFW